MATLAAEKPRTYELEPYELGSIPSVASDITYSGAAVGESSSTGTGRPLQGGDTFLGFARETCDNSAGAAGALDIRVQRLGKVWLPTITGASSIADLNATVYASDDDTFTLTATGGSAIGKIVRFESGRGFLVAFEADYERSI